MQFEELMDECKHGLKVASDNKVVFVPIFVSAAINILLIISLFIGIILFGIINGAEFRNIFNGNLPSIVMIISALLGFAFIYLIFVATKSMLEVGSINMYKAAIEGVTPRAEHFWNGIKRYAFRVFSTTVLIHILLIIFSIPILILLLIYAATIGILTAGWGMLLLVVFVSTFFCTWVIAVVEDDISGFAGIMASIKLGSEYFGGLFILMLSGILISKFVSTAFGILISLLVGWFLASVVISYIKIVLLIIYKRKKAM